MHQVPAIGAVAHVIQLAVAPVFLLTAIGTLLSVMTNRLSRVIDRARLLESKLESIPPDGLAAVHAHLATLTRRAKWINRAITLSTTTALLVCTVIAVLFLGDFLHFNITLPVAFLFITAMLLLVLALLSFLREIFIATVNLRIGPH
jgi:hypothetical protein